jgi:hypothetical protein
LYSLSDGYTSHPGLFLSNAGSSGSVIGILAYVRHAITAPSPGAYCQLPRFQSSNNIVSHSKRAIVSSVVISAGGVGGLLASNIFTQASAPRYLPGIVVTIISQFLLLTVLGATTIYFRRQNAWAIRESAQLEGHPGFLYTL